MLSPTTSLFAPYIPLKHVLNIYGKFHVSIPLTLLFILARIPIPCISTIKFQPLSKIQCNDISSMKLSLFHFKLKQVLSSYTLRRPRSLFVVMLSSTLLVTHVCSFPSFFGETIRYVNLFQLF